MLQYPWRCDKMEWPHPRTPDMENNRWEEHLEKHSKCDEHMTPSLGSTANHQCTLCSVTQWCPTLCDPMDCSLCPWNSPGKNTGVGCHSLLQGIFPTQGLNPDLLHCRQILYCLSQLWCLVAQLYPTLCDPMDCIPPGPLSKAILQERMLQLDCHALLQGIFPTQRLNPGLPHCRHLLYCLSHREACTLWRVNPYYCSTICLFCLKGMLRLGLYLSYSGRRSDSSL